MGTRRSFEEALFSPLTSTDFLQNLPKFCPEDTRREPKDLWMPLCKSSKNPPFPLSLTSRQPKHPKKISPKIFSNFWGTYIRCSGKHYPASTAPPSRHSPAPPPGGEPEKCAAQSNYPSRCTKMKIFTPGNTIKRLVRCVFFSPCK